MRQVNRDELIYAIQSGIRNWSAALRRDLNSGVVETRERARVIAAAALVDRVLKRFEVMTDTPLPNTMGEEAFSRPLDRLHGSWPDPLYDDANR